MNAPFYRDITLESEAVTHGFFGRRGGVSAGIYDSLNCGLGTKDNPACVMENHNRVCKALAAQGMTGVYQCHSAISLYTNRPWENDVVPQGDALVTDKPGLALRILTADCGPVLFRAEKENGAPVIAAAHAGWGGALKGVLENTVQTMVSHGAVLGTICAVIGPCIGPASYEVEHDFIKPFLERNPESDHFFRAARRQGHLMFDLPGYIAFRLAECGVLRVTISGHDTYALENEYFSYRRTTHRKESDYGRQISAIMIRP